MPRVQETRLLRDCHLQPEVVRDIRQSPAWRDSAGQARLGRSGFQVEGGPADGRHRQEQDSWHRGRPSAGGRVAETRYYLKSFSSIFKFKEF